MTQEFKTGTQSELLKDGYESIELLMIQEPDLLSLITLPMMQTMKIGLRSSCHHIDRNIACLNNECLLLLTVNYNELK